MARVEALPGSNEYCAWETQPPPTQSHLVPTTSSSAAVLSQERAAAARESRLANLSRQAAPPRGHLQPASKEETLERQLEPEPEVQPAQEPLWLRVLRANGVPEAERFPNKEFWTDESPVRTTSSPRRLSFRGDQALEHVKHIPARPQVLIDDALEDSGLVGVGHARENAQLFQASFLRLKAWAAGEAVRAEYKDRHGTSIRYTSA